MNQVAARESEWKVIDQELRTLARNRCRLDADEMPLLCAVIRMQVWRHFHMVTVFEYLEVVLGYGPRVARDRVRVALSLERMPVLAEALASGEQSYSALRELTRVATPETQDAWRADARGKNLRQIEEIVAVHEHGDLPTDPPKHDLKPRVLAYQVTTAIYAKERQVRRLLEDELGEALDDKTFIDTLLSLVLDGAHGADEGRARHQIQTTVCESCQLGWQDAGGRRFAISAVDVARAECDAQRIGSDREPAKASQDVTPTMRRYVFRRDRGNCVVPGCRSARNIEVHHIIPRAAGGSHEAENLTLLCGGHHDLLHEGRLRITGRTPALTFAKSPVVGANVKHVDARHGRIGSNDMTARTMSSGHVAGDTTAPTRSIGDDDDIVPTNDATARTVSIDLAHVGRIGGGTIDPTPRYSEPDRSRSIDLAHAGRIGDDDDIVPFDDASVRTMSIDLAQVGRIGGGKIDPTPRHDETTERSRSIDLAQVCRTGDDDEIVSTNDATARTVAIDLAHVGRFGGGDSFDPTPRHDETTERSRSIDHVDEADTSGRATSVDCAGRFGTGRTGSIDQSAHVGAAGDDAEFEPTIRTPPQRRNNYQWVVMKTEATRALAQAGFKNRARALVEQAAASAPPDITLEGLIRAALRASLAEG